MYRDVKGVWRTKTMFYDMCGPATRERYNPPFTLREEDIERDGIEYKSLYKLYMEATDEYDFVDRILGNHTHWKSLQKSKWFHDGHRNHRGVEAWREDMRARDASLAKRVLIVAAREGDTNAAKKLFDVSKLPAETKRGRFKKEEVIKEAVKKVEDKDFIEDSAIRLNIVKIRD